MNCPKIIDDDRDEITAEVEGHEIRGWSYASETERRVKMKMAHEFAEGWFQAIKGRAAMIDNALNNEREFCAALVAPTMNKHGPIAQPVERAILNRKHL